MFCASNVSCRDNLSLYAARQPFEPAPGDVLVSTSTAEHRNILLHLLLLLAAIADVFVQQSCCSAVMTTPFHYQHSLDHELSHAC
jgi:hypothetical protein